MIKEIYGKKIGMTQVFDAEGNQIPVTLVEVEQVCVLEKRVYSTKTKAIIGCFKLHEKKMNRINKPEIGYFKKLGIAPYRLIREVSIEEGADFNFTEEPKKSKPNAAEKEVPADTKDATEDEGSEKTDSEASQDEAKEEVKSNPRHLGVGLFNEGEIIDVRAKSKGKGFAGVMKRHNMAGQPGGHGSTMHRRVGSVGASAYPSRIMKGKRMPGHLGNKFVTIKKLKIVKIDKDKELLFIKGTVPGARGALVRVRKVK